MRSVPPHGRTSPLGQPDTAARSQLHNGDDPISWRDPCTGQVTEQQHSTVCRRRALPRKGCAAELCDVGWPDCHVSNPQHLNSPLTNAEEEPAGTNPARTSDRTEEKLWRQKFSGKENVKIETFMETPSHSNTWNVLTTAQKMKHRHKQRRLRTSLLRAGSRKAKATAVAEQGN